MHILNHMNTLSFSAVVDTNSLKTWAYVHEIGYIHRKEGLNGKDIWKRLKAVYSNYTFDCCRIPTPFIKELAKKYELVLEETDATLTIRGKIIRKTDDINHSVVQLIRIAAECNFEVSYVEFLQIAFNLGQYKINKERGLLSDDVISFVESNNLDKVSSYIGVIEPNVQIIKNF